jgi:hypothetical protein
MHARDLIELAALVSVHGPIFIRHGRVSESALQSYWSVSKARQAAWTLSLAEHADLSSQNWEHLSHEAAQMLAWQNIRPVLEEILATEILTRIWTAIACAHDNHRQQTILTPVVKNIYTGHLEARNQALHLLVNGRGCNTPDAVEMNRLRRRCERWCDMLLAYLATPTPMLEFSFEPTRAREFSADLSSELKRPLSNIGWQLVMVSLRTAFSQGLQESAAHPVLNRQIAEAILSCYDSDLFDATGVLNSLWMERIQHVTSDTEGMIAELLVLETTQNPRLGRYRLENF